MSTDAQLVQDILSSEDEVPFEEILDETHSPLNRPVIEKEVIDPLTVDFDAQLEDLPEQEINSTPIEEELSEVEPPEEPELPDAHAKQAADSLIGMADNLLAVGGGYFVKIKKHKEFYDFEEVIKLIDEQNEKNVSRIKLDKEDKALLRPLLVALLKKKAKTLSVEQQMMGCLISISIKKVQATLETRADNEALTERMLTVIREEKKSRHQEPENTNPKEEETQEAEEPLEKPEEESETQEGGDNG